MSTKLIITNFSALQSKYGKNGTKKIRTALNGLIKADKRKGLDTIICDISEPDVMKTLRGSAVTDPKNPKQNKAAIDTAYQNTNPTPDYVMLLGALDVIPYQRLVNPLYGSDSDKYVPSDLPYACEAGYSTKITDFIGPTRLIGRVPDIIGDTSETYLCTLLSCISNWQARSPATYLNYLGISAQVWQESTGLSLRKTFGDAQNIHLSPTEGPNWTKKHLAPYAHFINCHGAEASPTYYGQKGNNYPEALKADLVTGKLSEGTVAAAECCYGAELYNPALSGGQTCMANTYLGNAAYGFWGSTTIAYGPSAGNGQADYICQYFMQKMLDGASIGRAALTAWQTYIKNEGTLDPVDLKTVAQFYLLGDPSVHPVKTGVEVKNIAAPLRKSKAVSREAEIFLSGRFLRRRQLFSNGLALLSQTNVAVKTRKLIRSVGIEKSLQAILQKEGLKTEKMDTFKVRIPSSPHLLSTAMKSLPLKKMIRRQVKEVAYHVMSETRATEKNLPNRVTIIVAMEEGGQIVSYKRLQSK